jgi:transposase InsO family protein
MVKGLPCIQQPVGPCEICILGKHHRENFVSSVSYKEKSPLEIVHTDLCGPMQTPSLNGSVYFMTFIDDFSRKTWLYLLKQKSEAFDVFKRFKSMVENESGRTIKILRSDKGGEYKLNELIKFCDLHGIKRQFTS